MLFDPPGVLQVSVWFDDLGKAMRPQVDWDRKRYLQNSLLELART